MSSIEYMKEKVVVIIGAGPGGLTAAYELLKKDGYKPIILEMSSDIGGISKTVNYKGNRMDIGGHRFFSKSDRVMQWWQQILPIQKNTANKKSDIDITYHKQKTNVKYSPSGPDPEKVDKVMLIRNRLSRIYFLKKFFSYPVTLSKDTVVNLGPIRMTKIFFSYCKARITPIKEEKSLEDFFINRFGRELYLTFFKDYTEKVWGVPCDQINPDWGAQRIKGLSITAVLSHAIKSKLPKREGISQKGVETSLIEFFMYPKLGPGQLWEEVARQVKEKGAEIYMDSEVVKINYEKGEIKSVVVKNVKSGVENEFSGDYFISTMPVKDLILAMGERVDKKVVNIAKNLVYRDFITVGLLLKKLKITNKDNTKVKDNWIYIQERDVKIGRLQIFNNWSPYMVKNTDKVWVGLEYFCTKGDELWNMSDKDFIKFATGELAKIGIIEKEDVIDGNIIRMEKTYPVYYGAYEHFDVIRKFTDSISNLFLVGRNGMHRYNNSDHSMLTAMLAVDNIFSGITDKSNIWDVNAEGSYHEEK